MQFFLVRLNLGFGMLADCWDEETDLLVFGSGAAGLTAALVGAERGCRVMVCEKADQFGGTTATSGGAIWIAGSSQAARAGHSDSPEQGREYLWNETGAHANRTRIDAFVRAGPALVDLLERTTEVQFDVVPLPDYHAETRGGVTAGRVLIAKPYDGRALGNDFSLLASPRPPFMVLGGMMVGFAEIPMLTRPLQSWAALRHTCSILTRYAADRIRYPRGTRLVNGNALVARLFASLRKRSIDLRRSAGIINLVYEDGRVQGAEIRTAKGVRRVRATRGVVLATGGAARCSALHANLMGNFPHDHTLAAPTVTGDGVMAALAVGAALDRNVSSPGVWTPASVMRESNGSLTVFPYGYLDRGKPGAIAVNQQGLRFCNEANSYHDVVQAMYRETRAGEVPRAFLICDADFIRRYGFGLIRPHDLRLRRFLRAGYVTRASTLNDLARKIGVPASALEQTVIRHNGYARSGVDEDFGKGSTAFNRANGDARAKPNCNLAELKSSPFYALPITPATIAISVGLNTNEHAQVLSPEGRPIDGLYACGNDATSVMAGYCPGGGVTIGPAMVFGSLAAEHAASIRTEPQFARPVAATA
jgi:succinate dehydrogenase/fumarate reductase flavoprotein subunit